MKIQRIDHIHIVTKDLNGAARFFSDMLGTQWFGPRAPSQGIRVAFDNVGLELLEPGPTAPADDPIARRLRDYGEGVAWIGLKVVDLDEAVAELRAKGLRVEYATPAMVPKSEWKKNLRLAKTEDPEKTYGVVFELLEYEDMLPITFANWNIQGEIPRM